MRIKAVLFDLDGTLLDSVSAIMQSNRDVCEVMGIPYDEEMMRNWIGIPLADQARKLLPGRESEFMDNYRNVYVRYQGLDTKTFPGTLPMLDKLKKQEYLLGLVTSKNTRGTSRVIKLAGLEDKFDVIITADDVEHPKPHPEPVLKALKKLEVEPEGAVYVGDSLFDFDSAQGANVRALGVSWGARCKADLLLMCPDAVFDTWQEFMDWLDRVNSSRAGLSPSPQPSPSRGEGVKEEPLQTGGEHV